MRGSDCTLSVGSREQALSCAARPVAAPGHGAVGSAGRCVQRYVVPLGGTRTL